MSRSQPETTEPVIESRVYTDGELHIDLINGTATFRDHFGAIILRVTHLPTPVPSNVSIDLVAIRNVTSYTPIAP
jgi:hypothetical protein